MFKIYLGYDPREQRAYDVAEYSLRSCASVPISVTPLVLSKLERLGLMKRPRCSTGGKMVDLISGAPMSTEFAISRFLTPILAQTGWAMFADSDVVALDDVFRLDRLCDPSKAVMVVKHSQVVAEQFKMDGQVQTSYPRKNWSSVMLFNCDHPANRALTLELVNAAPGRDLHAFCWLDDDLIGELPSSWNWLVGAQPKPRSPSIAHFTLGGPWFDNWKGGPHDDIWTDEEARMQSLSRRKIGAVKGLS